MTRQRKAELWLILITLFWGTSYYFTDVCLSELSPLTLNAFRFVLAFAFMAAAFAKRLKSFNLTTLKYGVFIGAALVMTYIGATYGIKYTSISNAGFICALPVLFTPLFEFIFLRRRPEKKLAPALALCTVGLMLLTLGESFRPASGDLICLLCAVSYSVDILITERAVRDERVDPFVLTTCEMGFVGIVMLALSFIFEKPHIQTSPSVLLTVIFLGIVCSAVCFMIQASEQRYTKAGRVTLIFTLEPVFSALMAFFFANEVLSPRGYIGAALMLASLFVMNIDFSFLKRKK